VDMKKGARGRARARARPPSMSLSQGFSSVGRRAVSHTVGAVGHPLSNSKVPGMKVMQLQGFFVWKSYCSKRKLLLSARFCVRSDCSH
jgi:hypothetical protein